MLYRFASFDNLSTAAASRTARAHADATNPARCAASSTIALSSSDNRTEKIAPFASPATFGGRPRRIYTWLKRAVERGEYAKKGTKYRMKQSTGGDP